MNWNVSYNIHMYVYLLQFLHQKAIRNTCNWTNWINFSHSLKKGRVYTMGKQGVRGRWRRHLRKDKEPTVDFWLWVGNLGAGLRMFVLDWVLSESGGNAIIEYLINFICREGRRAKVKAEMAQEVEVTHTSCQRGVFGISWITWRFWSGCSLRLFISKRRRAWLCPKH